jgi:hypothetical protein
MYAPGEESIAEAVAPVRARDRRRPRHRIRGCSSTTARRLERHDLDTQRGLLAAITEASGDALAWTDVDAVASQYLEAAAKRDEGAKNEFRRYWLNQRRRCAAARSRRTCGARARAEARSPTATPVVLAFDGSYRRDSTALVGCTVEPKPHIFVVGRGSGRRRPAVAHAEARGRGRGRDGDGRPRRRRARAGSARLGHEIEEWEQMYGDVVVRFETNQPTRMGPACDEFTQALRDGEFTHDGDQALARHVSHCVAARRGRWVAGHEGAPGLAAEDRPRVGAIIAFHRARWHVRNPQAAGFTWRMA